MEDDRQLLQRYAADGSETAFGDLVARHLNLVYSAALRRTGGDAQLAQDIAQLVFTDLARKARSLPGNVVLGGWLHRATRYATAQLLRTERRRAAREQEAVTMNSILAQADSDPSRRSPTEADWAQIRPLLDEALDRLNADDRDALVLRFFEQRSLAQVGRALGANEDAARKRVTRALEKLRADLVRRGITTTAATLSAAISVNAVQAAPAGLAATLSASAMAGTALGATTTTTQAIAMTTLQKALVTATLTAAIGTALYGARQASTFGTRVRTLQQQQAPLVAQIRQLQQERDDATNQLALLRDQVERLNQNPAELLKLRGEVTRLRAVERELANFKTPQAPDDSSPPSAADAGQAVFRPAVETVLKRPARRVAELLDLDTGQSATSTNFGSNDRETHAWVRTNKVDLIGVVEKGQIAALCFDMAVVPAPTNGWETFQPSQIITNWGLNQQEPRPITDISPEKTDTWLFQTREKTYGILQILGQNDDPSGVKIRYKLVQGPARSSR